MRLFRKHLRSESVFDTKKGFISLFFQKNARSKFF